MNVWIRRSLQAGILAAGVIAVAPTAAYAYSDGSGVAITCSPSGSVAGFVGQQRVASVIVLGNASGKKSQLVATGVQRSETGAQDGAGWQTATKGAGWQTPQQGAGWQTAQLGAGWQV